MTFNTAPEVGRIADRVMSLAVFEMYCASHSENGMFEWLNIIVRPDGTVFSKNSEEEMSVDPESPRSLVAWTFSPCMMRTFVGSYYVEDIPICTRNLIRRRVDEWSKENLIHREEPAR